MAHDLHMEELVRRRVADYYWRDDINCATTNLKILSEIFGIDLSDQVIDAAVGMHGAGEYGAQCGLVEGALMFLGISGRRQNIADDAIIHACKAYAWQFEKRFSSLSCAALRPEGFAPNNPPHLCEAFTREAVGFTIEFMSVILNRVPGQRPKTLACIEKRRIER
jgi:hypothetical protein